MKDLLDGFYQLLPNFVVSVFSFSAVLVILLGPVLDYRWKKDGWCRLDLALLLLPNLPIEGLSAFESGDFQGGGVPITKTYLAAVGTAVLGWFRGGLVKVLPERRFSLYWGLLLFLLGVICYFSVAALA